jgi:hypothetical protein
MTLGNDCEDDLGLAVEPEPDQPVTLADLGFAHGLLEPCLVVGFSGSKAASPFLGQVRSGYRWSRSNPIMSGGAFRDGAPRKGPEDTAMR